MPDFVGVDVTGIPDLARRFESLGPIVQGAVVDEVSKYLLGVFRKYVPENHSPTRAQAYPETGDGFFSDKQRRRFFWALRTGRLSLPYSRTYTMQKGWVQLGRGAKSILINETTAAYYTMDDQGQARYSKLVGWKTTGQIISERQKATISAAEVGAKKGIKQARLSTS